MSVKFIRAAGLAFLCPFFAALALAASPRVWLVGPDYGGDFRQAFLAKLPDARITSEAGDSGDAQVLLLNRSGPDLPALLDEARRRHLEVLWADAPAASPEDEAFNRTAAELMRSQSVMTVEFNAFSRSLLPKDAPADAPFSPRQRRRQGEFLAEAALQWWSACAATNPDARHEKLWPGKPPAYEYAGPERLNKSARIDHVSEPEIVRFLPKKRTDAPVVIFFPGGGYGYVGFLRNGKEFADRLDPLGIAVIGLKYRTGRPREVPLLDARRAVRYVRMHAAEWGLDPARVGVAGQSAGANLVLNLAGHFDAGDVTSADPVERMSSRPDFMVVLTSWHYGENVSPFTFPADLPPVFLRHAKNDTSFRLAEQIVAQLQAAGTPLDYRFVEKGGHGAFELSPENPGAGWPDDFVSWLRDRGLFAPAAPLKF